MNDITEEIEPKSWLDNQRDQFFFEGKIEGKTEGKVEEKRMALKRVLHFRFGNVPEILLQKIFSITDVDQLEILVQASFNASDLSEFANILNKLK